MPFDRINLMNLFFAHKFQPHFQPKWANACSMKFQFSKQMRCIMEHNVLSVSKIEIELKLHGNALLLARVFRRKFDNKFGQKWHLIAYFNQKSKNNKMLKWCFHGKWRLTCFAQVMPEWQSHQKRSSSSSDSTKDFVRLQMLIGKTALCLASEWKYSYMDELLRDFENALHWVSRMISVEDTWPSSRKLFKCSLFLSLSFWPNLSIKKHFSLLIHLFPSAINNTLISWQLQSIRKLTIIHLTTN